MKARWLHVSDFHFRKGDPYDRDVVLRALVQSVERFRKDGRAPDLIFATGDIAFSGDAGEYEIATPFFDDLLAAADLERRHLFVVPGNHDVDRSRAAGLARTLQSEEEAVGYFKPSGPWHHLSKQSAFRDWYNRFFDGIRSFPEKSMCGPVEAVELQGRIGIIPINSALFCLDDNDHEKLWVGRRCLDPAIGKLKELDAQVTIVLLHHPLDWLHSDERANIKSALQSNADFVLRGHCHELDAEGIVGIRGSNLHLASGAAYQTRRWPNRAFYCDLDGEHLSVFPIRYEDHPQEVWTVDPSLFPTDPGYERSFPVPRLAGSAPTSEAPKDARTGRTPAIFEARATGAPDRFPGARGRGDGTASPTAPFRSNVPRLNRPFVGRDPLLDEIGRLLADTSRESTLVLQGPPGVGKSELAREYARQHLDDYPGGTFFVNFGAGMPPIDLAVIGKDILRLDYPAYLPIGDQCLQALLSFGSATTLLIYDNAHSEDDVAAWLPPARMPCHVLVTTVLERWGPGWPMVKVDPLSAPDSLRLVEELAGSKVARKYGDELVRLSGGLPVQICPSAATLAYEERRGRLDEAHLTIAREASQSFQGAFQLLDAQSQLALHAAARLNPDRIPRDEIARHLQEALDWSEGEVQRALDGCIDLNLLEGSSELRIHGLLASVVRALSLNPETALYLQEVRRVQARRLEELAGELSEHPANAETAAWLMVFPVRPEGWADLEEPMSPEKGETIGRALYEIGRFADALPWFERAVKAKEQGDIHGRVDHASLASSLREGAKVLRKLGRRAEAKAWEDRASKLEH